MSDRSRRLRAGPRGPEDPGRRRFLVAGLAGGFGLGLPALLRAAATPVPGDAPATFGRARSLIHVFLPGGIAHQESFDPKPYAPVQYRGPFGSTETRIPGVRFGEHLRQLARIAPKLTVVRSMTHSEAAHERGTHNMFTGYRPSPAIQYPSLGSVVAHELGSRNHLPPYVVIPRPLTEYAGSGYLSSAFGPFSVGGDPASNSFAVRDLNLPEGVGEERFARRRRLLSLVDDRFQALEASDSLDAMDSFYQSAYSLMQSAEAKTAFQLEEEPDKVRDEYGKDGPGARLLLARRLVEAGVRFVSTSIGVWDHHDNLRANFQRQAPRLDRALTALIQDLDRRGLLDTTLVLVTTEFGRTPKINQTDGRDHWPRVFSILLAGGGVAQGLVYGSSTALADEVESDPVQVEDLARTVYHLVGIDSERELRAPGNRPIEIVKGGRLLEEILA